MTDSLALDDVLELLKNALETGSLLELESPDGERLVINPKQVEVLKDGPSSPFHDARQSDGVTASA